VFGIIEASLTMMEDENSGIHYAALTCVTTFPWSVSLDLFYRATLCRVRLWPQKVVPPSVRLTVCDVQFSSGRPMFFIQVPAD